VDYLQHVHRLRDEVVLFPVSDGVAGLGRVGPLGLVGEIRRARLRARAVQRTQQDGPQGFTRVGFAIGEEAFAQPLPDESDVKSSLRIPVLILQKGSQVE
jgi:hypothetical protein